jgi:signal transduction histidine kinase
MNPEHMEKVIVYPIEGERGNPGGSIIRISDITGVRLLERRMVQKEKLAALGLLISGIVHDVNNPNNFISFNMPILREYLNEIIPIVDRHAEARGQYNLCGMSYAEFRTDLFKLLDNVEHGSRRIKTIVSDLREFVRRRDKGERRSVALKEVIENGVMICLGDLKRRVRSFHVDVPGDLPHIVTCPESLELILINLLVNAAEAVDKEDSWIRLRVVPGENKWADHMIIEVSDNGCGMDQSTREKLFDPFFTTKSPSAGTGLGLYICNTLLEGIDGHIEVESDMGERTVFRVILPGPVPETGATGSVSTP